MGQFGQKLTKDHPVIIQNRAFRHITALALPQIAINYSRSLKQTLESVLTSLNNLGIFRVRNWSNLDENWRNRTFRHAIGFFHAKWPSIARDIDF